MADKECLSSDEREQIRKIAENAIESISKLANIVEKKRPNSLNELQKIFPTAGSRTSSTVSSRVSNASNNRGSSVREINNSWSQDVKIMTLLCCVR